MRIIINCVCLVIFFWCSQYSVSANYIAPNDIIAESVNRYLPHITAAEYRKINKILNTALIEDSDEVTQEVVNSLIGTVTKNVMREGLMDGKNDKETDIMSNMI